MYKSKDPMTEFIIARVTKTEKSLLIENAIEDGVRFSQWIRIKLGLKHKKFMEYETKNIKNG